MSLGPYMINTVVRVMGERKHPKTGKRTHGPIGTGFYVRVPSERGDGHFSYVVTAHHVIDDQAKPELVFPDPHIPGGLYPPQPTERPDWLEPLGEKVDIAVLPFPRPDGFFVNQLELDKHILRTLPARSLLGMPFFYTGLLEPVDRAMARAGHLGAIYEKDIEHRDHYEYDCHLGDARSYGGFSGSPCFLEIALPGLKATPPPLPPEPGLGEVGRIRYAHPVCGMVTWHLEPAEARDEASLFGVVAILPNDYIWKALMAPELVQARKEADELSDEPDAILVNLSAIREQDKPLNDQYQSSEFENFDALASKLVKVPKSEIDAKRKQEESASRRRPRHDA